jgi:hypothetical protein
VDMEAVLGEDLDVVRSDSLAIFADDNDITDAILAPNILVRSTPVVAQDMKVEIHCVGRGVFEGTVFVFWDVGLISWAGSPCEDWQLDSGEDGGWLEDENWIGCVDELHNTFWKAPGRLGSRGGHSDTSDRGHRVDRKREDLGGIFKCTVARRNNRCACGILLLAEII